MRSSPRLSSCGALAFAMALVLGIGVQPIEAQQGVITGNAQDARSGQPLASVQISIASLDIGVLSAA